MSFGKRGTGVALWSRAALGRLPAGQRPPGPGRARRWPGSLTARAGSGRGGRGRGAPAPRGRCCWRRQPLRTFRAARGGRPATLGGSGFPAGSTGRCMGALPPLPPPAARRRTAEHATGGAVPRGLTCCWRRAGASPSASPRGSGGDAAGRSPGSPAAARLSPTAAALAAVSGAASARPRLRAARARTRARGGGGEGAARARGRLRAADACAWALHRAGAGSAPAPPPPSSRAAGPRRTAATANAGAAAPIAPTRSREPWTTVRWWVPRAGLP